MDRKFEKIAAWGIGVGAAALVLMVVLVALEIFVRKILNSSIYISIEYTGYALAAMMALGLAAVTQQKRHLTVDVLIERLPHRWRRGMDLAFSLLLFCIYSVFLTLICLRLFHQSLTLDIHSSTVAHTPMWVPQAILALGCGLLNLQLIADIIRWFRTGTQAASQ